MGEQGAVSRGRQSGQGRSCAAWTQTKPNQTKHSSGVCCLLDSTFPLQGQHALCTSGIAFSPRSPQFVISELRELRGVPVKDQTEGPLGVSSCLRLRNSSFNGAAVEKCEVSRKESELVIF